MPIWISAPNRTPVPQLFYQKDPEFLVKPTPSVIFEPSIEVIVKVPLSFTWLALLVVTREKLANSSPEVFQRHGVRTLLSHGFAFAVLFETAYPDRLIGMPL
jgi:hypothetical protein